MRKVIYIALIVACLGCATPNRVAYVSVGSLVSAVEQSRQAYVSYENSCQCVTQEEHDKVEAYYVRYQQAISLLSNLVSASGTDADISLQVADFQSAAQNLISLVEALLPTEQTKQLKTSIARVK